MTLAILPMDVVLVCFPSGQYLNFQRYPVVKRMCKLIKQKKKSKLTQVIMSSSSLSWHSYYIPNVDFTVVLLSVFKAKIFSGDIKTMHFQSVTILHKNISS